MNAVLLLIAMYLSGIIVAGACTTQNTVNQILDAPSARSRHCQMVALWDCVQLALHYAVPADVLINWRWMVLIHCAWIVKPRRNIQKPGWKCCVVGCKEHYYVYSIGCLYCTRQSGEPNTQYDKCVRFRFWQMAIQDWNCV